MTRFLVPAAVLAIACSSNSTGEDSTPSTTATGGSTSPGDVSPSGGALGTSSGGSLGTPASGGSSATASDCSSCKGVRSTTNGNQICKEQLNIAVYGDSNWTGGAIADALAALDPTSTYTNISGGSGKALPAMLNDDIAGQVAALGPIDIVLLGVGTNDGRCNPYVTCDGAPPATESWCAAPPAQVGTVTQNLKTFLDAMLTANPDVLPIVVGPAPTYDDAQFGTGVPPGPCGYSSLSSKFMEELSTAFLAEQTERGYPYIDIFAPIDEYADPDKPGYSTLMSDGVHYAFNGTGPMVVASEINALLSELRTCE